MGLQDTSKFKAGFANDADDAVQHTPGPWSWDAGLIPPDGPGRYSDIYTNDGETIIASFNDVISEGRANAALIVRACNLVMAGKAAQDAQQAKIKARGDLPPDLDWGLSENEIAAAQMMNALMDENDAMRAALKPFADLGVGSGPGDDTEIYRITRKAIRDARASHALSKSSEIGAIREHFRTAREAERGAPGDTGELEKIARAMALADSREMILATSDTSELHHASDSGWKDYLHMARAALPHLRGAEWQDDIRAIELAVDGLNTKGFRQKPETQAALDRIKVRCRMALTRGALLADDRGA